MVVRGGQVVGVDRNLIELIQVIFTQRAVCVWRYCDHQKWNYPLAHVRRFPNDIPPCKNILAQRPEVEPI